MLEWLEKIPGLLEKTKTQAGSPEKVRKILEKAKKRASLLPRNTHSEYVQGLSLEDAAILLNIDIEKHPELLDELSQTAFWIKQAIYGNRIVLFAPLYMSNLCTGGCLYCGYRSKNKELPRKILTDEEIVNEVKVLQKQGHRRLLLLCGDHPSYPFEDFIRGVKLVSSVTTKPFGKIRRINVEIPALAVEQFKALNATNTIGTYALFQETYHKETYQKMHPYGRKSDYHYRLYTMDRALQGGCDDVGIGALFGLYDYRYEVLGLLAHAQYLDHTYRVGPHTISIPRLQPAPHSEVSLSPPYPVDDKTFEKLTAIIRCAVPYTGLILSTRESPQMRRRLYYTGVSQISAGSRTETGSYSKKADPTSCQFNLNDTRSTSEVVEELLHLGFVPSWCTACYRLNRTGEHFMNIAKKGGIHHFCAPNSLLTFMEYLCDYANESTRIEGFKMIEQGINNIVNLETRKRLQKYMYRIKNHERDLFF